MKTILFIFISFAIATAAEIEPKLAQYLSEQNPHELNVWIFFKDKGPQEALSFSKASSFVSERALQRRAKMGNENLIKFTDYPVYESYQEQISANVIRIRNESRWLNAVSARVSPVQIGLIKNLDFVESIHFLPGYKRRDVDWENEPAKSLSKLSSDFGYGESDVQLLQIGVTALHNKGLSGEGIVIAMLDDGFNRYKTHRAFRNLKVLDTWDFINKDPDVADPNAQPVEGWHGTLTLSVVAGYVPDTLIGSAYNASFLLAKTEIDNQEIPQEEDNWVAGMEWAEARGADIINSSLGYTNWYSWQDLDGKTAITTKATIIAEKYGLIVVNSAGNDGYSEVNTLGAPADGEFVITVGGINLLGDRWSRSSVGPTADGRIKPDVCALASGVFRASYVVDDGFLVGSGTSFSSPLTAGAIALLLEAFPYLKPEDVRNVIKKTASQAGNPDNLLGYGILNVEAAYNYIQNDSLAISKTYILHQNRPNPFDRYTRIEYAVKNRSRVKLTVYDVLGRTIVAFPERIVEESQSEFLVNDQLGASGVYFYRIEGKEISSGKHFSDSRKMVLIKSKYSY